MSESQCATHLAYERAQQLQRVVVRLADHTKLMPGRAAVAQFERNDRHTLSEQPEAEPKRVLDITPVGRAHRFEDHVLELRKTKTNGCGLVEASASERPGQTLHRPLVHDSLGECGLTAGVAGDGLHG
jgi:hypothetical protein